MSETSRIRTLAAVLVAGLAALAFSLSGMLDGFASPFNSVVHADPKGIKYLGVGSCGGNGCHNQEIKGNKKASDTDIGHDEMQVWERSDMHSRAFLDNISKNKNKAKGLSGVKSKEIVTALKIQGEATASVRCTVCHTLSGFSNAESKARIPLDYAKDVSADDIKTEKFKPAHGVTCDNCHGPSEKYLQPHATKGWIATQRAAMPSDALFNATGFYDTKNLQLRSNLCVSCHLKIDSELLAAGHPEPAFELDSYCQSGWIHWRPQPAFSGAKVWAMGQFACLRESAIQLADRVTANPKVDPKLVHASYQKLAAHLLMARHPAQLIAPDLEKAIIAQFTVVNENWSDTAKVSTALHTLGQTADSLSEKLQNTAIDKAMADVLISDVSAEGIAVGVKDFRSAFQYTYAMASLWKTNFLLGEAPDADKVELDKKIRDTPKFQKNTLLFDEIYDAKKYDPTTFVKAVKDVMALYKGGVAMPLPGKEPDEIAKLNDPVIVAARAAFGGAPVAAVDDKAAAEKAAAEKAAAEKAAAEKAAADKVAAEKAAAEKVAAEKAAASAKPEDKAAAEKAAAEKAAADKVAAEKAAAEKAAADKIAAEKAAADKAAAEKAEAEKAAIAAAAKAKAEADKNAPAGVPGFIFCPRCGQKNSKESNFCARCGLKLPKLDE